MFRKCSTFQFDLTFSRVSFFFFPSLFKIQCAKILFNHSSFRPKNNENVSKRSSFGTRILPSILVHDFLAIKI